jgi:WD40 repeat protein
LAVTATVITIPVGGALAVARPWNQPDEPSSQTSRSLQFVGALTDTGEVRSLAISPDGKVLATGGGNNHTARLWSSVTGNHLRTINTGYVVDDVTFNFDGKLLSTSADVWNVDTGERASKVEVYGYGSAFSPSGETLAVSSSGGEGVNGSNVVLCNVTTGKVTTTLPGYSSSVAFTPNGDLLSTGDLDGAVRLWNVVTGKVVITLSGRNEISSKQPFSPDGRLMITSSGSSGSNEGVIRLWNVATGTIVTTLFTQAFIPHSTAFSPDGKFLAAGGEDGTMRLWNLANSRTIMTVTAHTGSVNNVAFIPDSVTLVTGDDTTVRFWRLPI